MSPSSMHFGFAIIISYNNQKYNLKNKTEQKTHKKIPQKPKPKPNNPQTKHHHIENAEQSNYIIFIHG